MLGILISTKGQRSHARKSLALLFCILAVLGGVLAIAAPDNSLPSEAEKEERRRRVKVIDLEGQLFVGEYGLKGSTEGKPISFSVLNTKWTSSYGTENGYATSSYGAYIRNDTTYVQLQQSSRKLKASLDWQGTIDGDLFTGTMTQFVDGTPPKIMWVKATRSKEVVKPKK